MQIALLWAECTGKTQLSHALVHALSSEGEDSAYAVPEVLRAWCIQQGRTPQPHEQEAIAHAQALSMNSALAHTFTLADTTPLMTAVYSDVLFQDPSLYPFALSLREEAMVISRMLAKQRMQERRLTDTGSPGDGRPVDTGTTDLIGL